MSGRELRKLFVDFNERYFDGKLPAYSVRVVDRITKLGESGRCISKRKLIEIAKGQSDSQTVSTLLHEMAHAVTSGGHGKRWKAEMIHLQNAGAPLAPPDTTVTLEDWSGSRVTKAQFSDVVRDAFLDRQDLTLRQAIKFFIRTEGGPPTVAEFLRRYTWARRVFNEIKREARTHEKQMQALRERLTAEAGAD